MADIVLALVFALYGLGHVWLGWVPDEGYEGGPRRTEHAAWSC